LVDTSLPNPSSIHPSIVALCGGGGGGGVRMDQDQNFPSTALAWLTRQRTG